jgi:flagellar hook-associated protein 3 FlgL
MRVTDKIMYDQMRFSVMDSRDRLFSIQQKISSNRKLTSLSDDPRGSEKASQLKSSQSELDQFQRNIQSGKTSLELTGAALQGVEDLLVRAKEISIQFSNSENSAEDRKMAAEEVAGILRQVVSYANSKNGSDYLFSGFSSTTPAYSATGGWQGDQGTKEIRIGQGERMATNEIGSSVFGSSAAAGGVPAGGLLKDLQDFQTALAGNDMAGIGNAITSMDSGMQSVLESQGTVGTRIKHMEVLDSAIGNMLVTFAGQLSGIEDLDIAEMATELAKQQSAYQAAIQVAGKIASMSILDGLK